MWLYIDALSQLPISKRDISLVCCVSNKPSASMNMKTDNPYIKCTRKLPPEINSLISCASPGQMIQDDL